MGLHGRAYETSLAADRPKDPTPLFYGNSACVNCHKNGDLKDAVCRGDELSRWNKDDKHRLAYEALTSDLGQQIAKRLGIQGPVTEKKECLTCHSVYIEDAELRNKSLKENLNVQEGISCVICHGPYEDWVDLHGTSLKIKQQEWRAKSREEKDAAFGMTDLWDPARRAAICVSCHVGNTKDGKVVTHAMYAAGHPPLPGVETATFCNAMPRHWELLTEKKPAVQKILQFNSDEKEQTRLVVESGVATYVESLRFLSGQAKQCLAQDNSEKHVLDLAQFDCYACHHDLKTPSWRQKRGYTGKPGRVPMRPWPLALVRLGIRQAAGDDKKLYQEYADQLKAGQDKLTKAFDVQPYGDAKDIGAAADESAKWAEALLKKLQEGATKDRKYNAVSAWRCLRELATVREIVDFDSARQIAWAFRSIYTELHPDEKGPVFDVLRQIDQELNLTLPAGQQYKIRDELPRILEKMSAYRPDQFTKRLAELAKLLDEEKP
jgi:hypothetical protein